MSISAHDGFIVLVFPFQSRMVFSRKKGVLSMKIALTVLFLTSLIILSLFAYRRYNSNLPGDTAGERYSDANSSQELENKLTYQVEHEANEEKTLVQKKVSDIQKGIALLTSVATGEEGREIAHWQNERGYFYGDGDSWENEVSDYDSYSDEVLKKLAIGGDRRASLIIGKKLAHISSPDTWGEAKEYLIEASVRGYSASLIEIGNLKIRDFVMARNKQDYETSMQAAIESRAWFEVALERGDPYARSHIRSLNKMYKIEFTEKEEETVQKLKMDLFSALVTNREQLGLPPFDNSYPAGLEILIQYTSLQ